MYNSIVLVLKSPTYTSLNLGLNPVIIKGLKSI